jgi:hypothetical protein
VGVLLPKAALTAKTPTPWLAAAAFMVAPVRAGWEFGVLSPEFVQTCE